MDFIERGREIIRREGEGLLAVASLLDQHFATACELVAACRGKIVVTGVGKAGIIAKKISATMTSTGTSSIWLDPVNALHGDLGMVEENDVALLLSNSGSSAEMLTAAAALRNMGAILIAITRCIDTPLSRRCDYVLPLGVHAEACPLALAPSTSTTAMLGLGDALALTVLQVKGFTESDYARFHPSGALGRKLMYVHTLMRTGAAVAKVQEGASVMEALHALTSARSGLCIVTDEQDRLKGVYTDGDFRRNVMSGYDILAGTVDFGMTTSCVYIPEDALVQDAIELMTKRHVNMVPVVAKSLQVVGALDIQDII